MSLRTLPLELPFKGGRDYLHGTDVYEDLASLAARELGSGIYRFQMALHRFFARQPDLHWSEDQQQPARPRDAVADFSAAARARKLSGWLSESGRPVGHRVEYDEDRIASRCSFARDSIRIEGETGFLPIEVAVSMTKVLHYRRMPPAAGRWIFTKLDLRRLLAAADAAALSIVLRDNLHGRLTKSDILARGEAVGAIYFSLVR